MIGAKYCEESLISDCEEDDDSIEVVRNPFSKSCGNFRTISYDPMVKKKISVPRIEQSSKKSVRRSAALISAKGFNDHRSSESRQKFLCCDRCANSGSRGQDRRRRPQSRINVRDCGGSISHGVTERRRRVSLRTSSSSFLGQRPAREFPLLRKKVSSEKWEENNFKSVDNSACNCGSSNRFLRPKFIRPSQVKRDNLPCSESVRKSNRRFLKPENLPSRKSDKRFLNIVSSSDDQDVDYQVPIEYSKSCESCSANIGPKSSHITVRICSANSVSSLSSDCPDDHRSLDSKSSLQDLEERVGRGLRAMCCCCSSDGAENCLSGSIKAGISEAESCDFKILPKTKYYRSRGSEFGERNSCCCNKCRKKLFHSCDKPDGSMKCRSEEYNQTKYEDVSTSECEEASFGDKFMKRRITKTRSNARFNRCFPSSSSKFYENFNSELENRNPRLGVTKSWCQRRDCRNETSGSPIVLSAPEYRNFLERCQRIRESIRCMMRDKFPCENGRRECEITADKTGSKCSSKILENLRPMEHWSQYGERMRDVANEYKRLRLCLDQMEPEKKMDSGFPGTKRGGAFLPEESEEKCDRCKLPPGENSRSVWFEKIEKEKESCCKKEVERIEEMREREADLVRTLERFCEKIKRVKSEFDKPFLPRLPWSKKNGTVVNKFRCNEPSCRKKMKTRKRHGKFKAKKLLIFPPEGEDGPPLTLFKNSSSVNCRVKGDPEKGFKYNVTYVQRFVSSTWYPSRNEDEGYSVDSG